MNAGIVIKIEYRFAGGSSYTDLSFTGFSANYTSDQTNTAEGIGFSTKIAGKIAKIGETITDTLKSIAGPKLEIRFTDGNGTVYTAGSASYPARFQYSMKIGGNPGDHNGYEFSITHFSPDGPAVADS